MPLGRPDHPCGWLPDTDIPAKQAATPVKQLAPLVKLFTFRMQRLLRLFFDIVTKKRGPLKP